MAVMLKRKHELLALKVSLRLASREPLVQLELESNEKGVPRTIDTWTLGVSDMGLPARLPARGMPTMSLPAHVLDALEARIAELDMPPWQPLWLHMMKPYGFLGFVPWEGLLERAAHRTIFRLPDFLERPRENRSVLDVALCSSAPVSEPSIYPPQLLKTITDHILSSSPRPRTSVHIFADEQFYDELRDAFSNDSRVSVHDPAGAEQYGEQTRGTTVLDTPRIRCPWLLWIRDAMKGRSLDAVHFVCHGYLAQDRPALSLAESPLRNRDPDHARYVGVSELATFLTQTGAWSAIFADPPENYSEAGLRLLADTLAQARPGPVLYHSIAQGHPDAFDAAYRFLFARDPGEPPKLDPAMFTYCQPALVESEALPVRPRTSKAIEINAALFADEPVPVSAPPAPPAVPERGAPAAAPMQPAPPPQAVPPVQPLENVPSWLSAAQRHVEAVSLDLQRRKASATRTSGSAARRADVATTTLDELQQIVANFVRSTRRDDPS